MGDRGMFPDLAGMTGIDRSKGSNFGDPYGMKSLGRDMKGLINPNPLKEVGEVYDIDDETFFESFFDEKSSEQAKMTSDLRSTLKSLESRINIDRGQVITESSDDEEIV